MLEPTTSTPSPRNILDFHDTISKSTQDLGFFNNHTRVSRILAGNFVVFQVLLLFTNASFTSQKFSERQNFGSIALHNSQNLKKNIKTSRSPIWTSPHLKTSHLVLIVKETSRMVSTLLPRNEVLSYGFDSAARSAVPHIITGSIICALVGFVPVLPTSSSGREDFLYHKA